MHYQPLHDALFSWYQTHGRHDLPWRNTRDPYPIYLSEIMLQQTQVATVLERFYFPFLERFPTLKSVAEAPEEAVLKAWQGLGYYTRARNLHACAKACDGTLPGSAAELEQLPGIGKSTARAVAAFAYHEPVAILDANVKRIIHRFFALASPTPKTLWEKTDALLDAARPYDYNQAMMDLGATVCTPKAPECAVCPLASGCRGKTDPTAYPEPKKKKAVPHHARYALVQLHKGKIGLMLRKEKLLGGLWGFVQQDTAPEVHELLGTARHAYSHFKLTLSACLVEGDLPGCDGWFSLEEIAALPLSKIDETILAMVKHRFETV